MDKDLAARVIQRWFRKTLSKSECTISHSTFMSNYEIVLDKQVYNANELYISLKYTSKVPHSRRDLTQEEINMILEKYNPFDCSLKDAKEKTSHKYNKDGYEEYEVFGSSPKPPMSFVINKSSILCL
jgi:hypothetical protein